MIVVWRVVDSCNLSCPFCAFDKRLVFPRTHADPKEILRFANVLAEYQSQMGDSVLLSWLGGEPLNWKPLRALSDSIRALGLEVSATTNGSTLGKPSVRRHVCDTYKELTISVDGFPDFHNSMRGWPGGFEELSSWVPALAREARQGGSRLKLRANIVLMHQNIADIEELCLALASWGIAEISFNQLGGRDRPEFYPGHRLTISDICTLEGKLPDIRRQLSDRGTALIGGEEYLARIRASAFNQAVSIEDCRPGEHFVFIDEKGRISPCSFTSLEYGINSETIRTSVDFARLPSIFRNFRRAKRSSQCDDCLSTQACGKFERSLGETLT